MDLSKAIELWNQDPEHRKALATLKEAGAFFFATPEGLIDAARTMQAKPIYDRRGSVPGGKTFASVAAKRVPEPTDEAAPGCGALLFLGQNEDLGIDYTGVSERDRCVVGLLAHAAGGMPPAIEADLAYKLKNKVPLHDRTWDAAAQKWDALAAKQDRTDEEESLYRTVRARLRYATERDLAPRSLSHVAPPRRESPPPYPPATVNIGGDAHESVVVAGSGNTVTPGAKSPPLIYVLCAQEDRAAWDRILRDSAVDRRNGLYRLDCNLSIRAGLDVNHVMITGLQHATLLVPVLSTDFLANETLALTLDQWLDVRRTVPILYRPVSLAGEAVSRKARLPRDDKSIKSHSDQDEVWMQVMAGLRAVVRSL